MEVGALGHFHSVCNNLSNPQDGSASSANAKNILGTRLEV